MICLLTLIFASNCNQSKPEYPPYVTPITKGPVVTNNNEASSTKDNMPIPIRSKKPDYIIDHFQSSEALITPEMIPLLKKIINDANQTTDNIELQGWTSGSPDARTFPIQKELALLRAQTIANHLITNGIPSERIIINQVVGQGLEHEKDKYRNQKVDIYLVPGQERIELNAAINCPPGYNGQYSYEQILIDNHLLLKIQTNCLPITP